MSVDNYVLAAISRIDSALVRIESKVDDINLHGCAMRLTDEARIKDIGERVEKNEAWIKKGIYGLFGMLFTAAIATLKYILQVR